VSSRRRVYLIFRPSSEDDLGASISREQRCEEASEPWEGLAAVIPPFLDAGKPTIFWPDACIAVRQVPNKKLVGSARTRVDSVALDNAAPLDGGAAAGPTIAQLAAEHQ